MQQSTTPKAPQTERGECHVADHREVWSRVLPSMQRMHAMFTDQSWTVEGIRELLDAGKALLIVGDGDEEAFAVVRLDEYLYDPKQLELFVLLVWHHNGDDVIERFHEKFDEMARTAGARYIRFFSRRPAMIRLVQQYGYMPRGVEYVKELSHGR